MNGIEYVKCIIRPGGFSGERTFQLTLANGEKFSGTASVRYLRDEAGHELAHNIPKPGDAINGRVMCRIVEREDTGYAVIEVPSADLAYVRDEELAQVA